MLSGEDGQKGQQQLAQGNALGIMLSPMYALHRGAKELIIFIWGNSFALGVCNTRP